MASIIDSITRWFQPERGNSSDRRFTDSFFKTLGGLSAQYDYDNRTYLDKGYGMNPDVFAVLQQQADKTKAVPFYVREITDNRAYRKLQNLQNTTKGDYSIKQFANAALLQTKAYSEEELAFPMSRPNPLQTWSEMFALWKIFMKSNGNAYFYIVAPDAGRNEGVPIAVYLLPSHLIKIVLKEDADLIDTESPIDHYTLIEGREFIDFPAANIIHTKYPNPFFDMAGSHLYGLSPMRALLRNLESSNEALNNNVKTMKNSGVFGFITAKDQALNAEQATQLKSKLIEMDNNSARLAKIAGMSIPVEFTKLSLTTDELKPFDFLKYDQKQICNVLNWSDSLLNNDDGGKYDKQKEERKRMITDNILPDLIMLQEALTFGFLRRFKGYEKAVIEFDVTELPEMQEDFKLMVDWMQNAPLTENEKRLALKYETIDDEAMDVVWISAGKKRIDEVGLTIEDIQKSYDFKNDL